MLILQPLNFASVRMSGSVNKCEENNIMCSRDLLILNQAKRALTHSLTRAAFEEMNLESPLCEEDCLNGSNLRVFMHEGMYMMYHVSACGC